MLRAVNEGFVKLKIEVDVDAAYDTIDDLISKIKIKLRHIQLAIEDSFKRLLNRLFQMKLYRKPNPRMQIPSRFCY
jgi:uncharacterized protein